MPQDPLRQLMSVDSEFILKCLLQEQHLHPRRPLGEALLDAGRQVGFCPEVAQRSAAWLELDPAQAIGRFRRTELTQLSRSLYRMWRLTLVQPATVATRASA